ncbi:MAG TPA: hypothetical protein VGI39_19005 [Polyangiaceae bacterium]|jgi:hypothetical protein
MKPSPCEPFCLDFPLRELATERLDASAVASRLDVSAAGVRCKKHGRPVRKLDVRVEHDTARVTVSPCCSRIREALRTHLRETARRDDPRASAPDSREEAPRAQAPGAFPPPTALPFAPLGPRSTGRRAVSAEVAARYADAGRLQTIVRTNGETVDVLSGDAAKDEPLPAAADGGAPPCTVENLRLRTRGLIAEATKLALRERRPLSDYASIVDWDHQVMRVQPVYQVRKLFVEAGDVTPLVEELDANTVGTMLIFVFAKDRYDRTIRITARGFVVGSEGGVS